MCGLNNVNNYDLSCYRAVKLGDRGCGSGSTGMTVAPIILGGIGGVFVLGIIILAGVKNCNGTKNLANSNRTERSAYYSGGRSEGGGHSSSGGGRHSRHTTNSHTRFGGGFGGGCGGGGGGDGGGGGGGGGDGGGGGGGGDGGGGGGF